MNQPGLTRRGAFTAGAGALALLGHAPRVLAARLRRDTPELTVQALGRLGPGSTTVRLQRLADLLALEWQEPPRATPQLRFLGPDGRWSPWTAAAHAAHEGVAAIGPTVGEPLWTGGTTLLQLRSAHALSGVRLHGVDVSGGAGAARRAAQANPRGLSAGASLAQPVLAAGAGQPPILARSTWARGECPPSHAPAYGSVELGFVHHTQSPNGYSPAEVPAMLRAIYVFHRHVRGWHDIGYNFAVDGFGRVFEARAGGVDEAVIGSHAGGYNTYSTGVAMLGSFTGRPVSAAARATLELLLAWKLALHGIPARGNVPVTVDPAGAVYSRYPAGSEVSLPRIAGHRDADTTDCPGDALYRQLPGIRARAEALSGHPVAATIALVGPTPPGGAPSAVAPGLTGGGLVGTLTLLDGTPLAGQPVLIQARSVSRRGQVVLEQPLAQTLTNSEGQWTLAAGTPSPRPLWLRAFFPGAGPYGAAVSEAITAPFSPAAPPAP